MGKCVCLGAMLKCSFGMAPSALIVLPMAKVLSSFMPLATVMDNKPIVNIPPFGMCQSMANPQVAAATATAMGVLTPMPCMPSTVAPWSPGSNTVKIGGNPALMDNSKLTCMWGGSIQINNPVVTTVNVS